MNPYGYFMFLGKGYVWANEELRRIVWINNIVSVNFIFMVNAVSAFSL